MSSHNASSAAAPQATPYERIGGAPAVRQLVKRFYELMDEMPEVWETRRIHPKDLSGSEEKLFKFLSGWLGGPQLYVAEYGHPMLRRRHLPFAISTRERDQWLMCMHQALEEQDMDPELHAAIRAAIDGLADHMRNQAE